MVDQLNLVGRPIRLLIGSSVFHVWILLCCNLSIRRLYDCLSSKAGGRQTIFFRWIKQPRWPLVRAPAEQPQVDVLLYMALGNTLGSHLLALGRLAPVQVGRSLTPHRNDQSASPMHTKEKYTIPLLKNARRRIQGIAWGCIDVYQRRCCLS